MPAGFTDPFTDNIIPPDSPVSIRHTLYLDSKAPIPSGTETTDRPHIPTALVVIGLEYATDMSQRALVRVLTEGRIALLKTAGDGWLETRLRENDGDEEETWDLPISEIDPSISTL
jgi:hypothetical protein